MKFVKKDYNRNALTKLAAIAALAVLMICVLAACTTSTELTPIGSPSPSPAKLNPLPSVGPSSGVDNTNPLASPSVQPSPSEPPAAPTLSTQESAALAGQCDTRISQISEIESSITVMLGDKTLTGVTFAPQYKGELTTRINGIISDSVRTVAPTIANVKVTSDADVAARIAALRDKQSQGGSSDDIRNEFNKIDQAMK